MNAPANIPATKQSIWALIVVDHSASLTEVIRLADRHPQDGMLQDMRRTAERDLRGLIQESRNPHFPDTAHGYGSIGTWGQNGHAPRIRHLLQSAQFRDQTLSERAADRRGAA